MFMAPRIKQEVEAAILRTNRQVYREAKKHSDVEMEPVHSRRNNWNFCTGALLYAPKGTNRNGEHECHC